MSPQSDALLASVIGRMALAVALVIALTLPVGYFTVAYKALASHLDLEAEGKAGVITTLASGNPELWLYEVQRMEELLARYPVPLGGNDTATIRDATDHILISIGNPPPPLTLRRSHAVHESGRVVGRVEIAHPLREIIIGTALATLLGLLLGGAVYATLRILPLRSLRRATAELIGEKERYATAVESGMDGYAVVDTKGRFLEANAALCALSGYSRHELLRFTITDVEAADTESQIAARIASITASGRVRFETRWKKKDGVIIDVEVAATYRARNYGEIFFFIHDITGRKQGIAALHASEERFRGLIEQSVTGIFIVRWPTLVYANPRFAELLSCRLDEILDTDISGFVHPEDLPMVEEQRRRTEQGGYTAFNLRARRKDGVEIVLGVNTLRTIFDGKSAIIGMTQDITERQRAQDQIAAHVKQLEASMLGTVYAISKMVELRDPYTAGHERRVGALAKAIGAELGLAEERCKGLEMIGLVHDIGKIVAPAEILSKPVRLTPAEFELIKAHSQAGYDILKDVEFPWPLAETILQHHERLDGSGYPRGLKGDAILLEARIVAVADVVEAMASHRPYRPGLGIEKALEEITLNRGKTYAPEAVDACIKLFRERGYTLPA